MTSVTMERYSREIYEGKRRGRTPLLGPPKDMVSRALEMGFCLHAGNDFGKHGGTPLS
jgi:hypothetical protein